MSRGGYRKGSGLKSSWKHGKTKVIRVPEVLAEKILDYARKIDTLNYEPVTDNTVVVNSKSLDLSKIPIYSFDKGSGIYLADLISFGYELKPVALHNLIVNKTRLKQQSRAKSLKNDINQAIKNLGDNND